MSKKGKKGTKLDWATFCEDYGDSKPSAFGRSRPKTNALPSGPSGLPSGPGGGGGDRYGARGGREERGGFGGGRKGADENAGRSDGAGNWRRGGSSFGGGGSSSFGGGSRSAFGGSSRDRGGDRDDDRDGGDRLGPSKADESNNWRSMKKTAAPARRPMIRNTVSTPAPIRERPKFNDRPADRPKPVERDPPRFGSAVRRDPPPREMPPRRETRDEPRRSYVTDRPPVRDDLDMGSFRNRPGGGAAPRPTFTSTINRDGPRRNFGAPSNRYPANEDDKRDQRPVDFDVDAAGEWKAQQKRIKDLERGRMEGPKKDFLCEGTARIKAAPLNAWGSRGNPISGPSRPRGSAAPMGRPEPARAPPHRQAPRRIPTRFSGTPSGFGYELVQRLMQGGVPGRGNRANAPRQANSRFSRPADLRPVPRGDNRFREDNGRRPIGNDRREGEAAGAVNLNQKRAEAGGRGPTDFDRSGDRSGERSGDRSGDVRSQPTTSASPPTSRQTQEEAFPVLPDAPKMERAKVPPNTTRIKKEAEAKKRREEEEKQKGIEEAKKRQAQENLLKSKDFVNALGVSDAIPADILSAGLSVINDHPGISIKSKYKRLCSTLEFKTPTHDPDLPEQLVEDLLSTCIAVTLMKKTVEAPQVFGILTEHCTDRDVIASVSEKAFKYILKRAKGDDSRLIALVEGVDVLTLLNAPEDKDDWDDFLEEKELICLAPPEDIGEEIATAVEEDASPSELLDILADAQTLLPSICKQIATYLADRYVKGEQVAADFVDATVSSLFKKIAASEQSQIAAINSLTNRWYEGGKKRSAFILLIKALYDKEVVPATTLVEWKDCKGTKSKQAALLDSYDQELVGGKEVINMSDYIQKIDPANQRSKQEEESESEDEDEVHNDYLGGDALRAHHGQDAIPDDDYGEWSD